MSGPASLPPCCPPDLPSRPPASPPDGPGRPRTHLELDLRLSLGGHRGDPAGESGYGTCAPQRPRPGRARGKAGTRRETVGGGREAGRKTQGAARSLSSPPPPRAHPKGIPTPAAALAGPDPPGPTATFRKTLRACPTEAGKMAEARFKCRRRRGRRRAEGAEPRGAEQRRRAQPRGSRARARRHGPSDSAGQSAHRKREKRGGSRGAGGRERARTPSRRSS